MFKCQSYLKSRVNQEHFQEEVNSKSGFKQTWLMRRKSSVGLDYFTVEFPVSLCTRNLV